MFYSSTIFVTKGKLAPIWLAANWEKKLTKKEVSEISLPDSVKQIIKPSQPLALRLSGKLLMGVVRLWQRQMDYLHEDCNDALHRIRKSHPKPKKKGLLRPEDSSDLITISEDFVHDLFADMPSDMSLLSVEGFQSIMDEGRSEMNLARAQDIQLNEDTTSDLDVSTTLDDGSLLLNDEHGDQVDEMCEDGSGVYSRLVDALKLDIKHRKEESSVEKGKNLSLNSTDLHRSRVDQLPDDDMFVDSENSRDVNLKQDLSVSGVAIEGRLNKDLSLNSSIQLRREFSALPWTDLPPDGSIQVAKEPTGVLPVAKKKKRRSRRRRRPQMDNITELANEIISAQLKDTSDIVWSRRPYADLRSRAERLYSPLSDQNSLLFKPMLPRYATELLEFYDTTWRDRKRIKSCHNPGCSLSESLDNEFNDSPPGSPISLPFSIGFNHLEPNLGISLPSVSSLGNLLLPVAESKTVTIAQTFDLGVDYGADEITDENTDCGVVSDDEARGWSERTQKMLQYLSNKRETSFVYQEMVRGKSRKTAVGFFYELLVLKTHGLVELTQREPYGQIDFSKTNDIIKQED